MRIIFFNIWQGQIWDGLKDFLQKESLQTDIFGFTEVNPDLEVRLREILPGFNHVYQKIIKLKDGSTEGGEIFIKGNIEILDSSGFQVFRSTPGDAGGIQYLKIKAGDKDLHIASVHGKTRPGSKKDTPIRLEQSLKIIDFFKDKKGPKIIGGDFNLYPDTKSVAMFEEAGYKNLIKDFNITNTRNRISWEYPGNVHQNFADFAFVSPDVKVKKFEVPYTEISDHLPLVLDFEI